MQKKTITTICFVVLVIAIIWGAVWYDSSEEQKNNDAQAQAAAAAAIAAQSAAQPQVTVETTSTQNTHNTQNTQNTMTQTLKITDVKVGTGAEVKNGDTVSVLYSGSLDDGTVFDASVKHGNQPFSFVVGASQVIKGWDLGLVGMKVGGTRELVIPSDLGYGPQGAGTSIPPNATLHFTVQLLSIGTGSAGNAGQ